MSQSNANYASLVAGGNVNPCRFIKLDSSADFQAVLATAATDDLFGISQDAQRTAPITGASDYAAVSGESLPHYENGSVCLLELGSGGATRGNLLVSDGSGKGVVAASSGTALQCIGAQALESGSAGEFIRVKIQIGYRRYALV